MTTTPTFAPAPPRFVCRGWTVGNTHYTCLTTSHRATLAGGITVSLDPAVFGMTLTIADELRALTLVLTPEQVDEMATWEAERWGDDYDGAPMNHTELCAADVESFVYVARVRVGFNARQRFAAKRDDIATLRDLAQAAKGGQ